MTSSSKSLSKPPDSAAPVAAGTDERYVKVTWSDDGRHRVQIVGFRRRHDVEKLLRAVSRHAFACQMRGLPIDTVETQRPNIGETDEAP